MPNHGKSSGDGLMNNTVGIPDRRRFMSMVGAAGGTALLAGCLGNGDDGGNNNASTDELPETTATIGHGDPQDPMTQTPRWAHETKRYVEHHTDGRFSIEISEGGALGSYPDMIEQVMEGSLEITLPAEGHLSTVYRNINSYALPFQFLELEQALHVFDTADYGDRLLADMQEQTGLRTLGTWENGGFRNFFVNTDTAGREIREPSDIEGLSFRTMQIEAHMEIVRSLGGTPEPIDWTELYSALEQGVVDGAELPIPVYLIPSLYEVTDFMILNGHVWSMAFAVCNNEWFEDLHPQHRQILAEGSVWGAINARRIGRILRERGIQIMEDNGVTVYDPPIETLEEFQAITSDPVREIVEQEVDDTRWVEEVVEASDWAWDDLEYTS